MALQNGPEGPGGWAALASAAGVALAWFVYYIRRLMKQPALDPATKAFLEGIKADFERLEETVTKDLESMKGANKEVVLHIERAFEGFRLELGKKTAEIAVIDKGLAVAQAEIRNLKNGKK